MKLSAFTIISEAERLCYPYIESIKSFLPLVDELIVVHNCISEFQDGSKEKIESIGNPKIKIISGVFDYERFGWASQGIMRTNGYYACTGDMVLMFDCDGLIHEKDIDYFKQELTKIFNSNKAYGYWLKKRFNQPEKWVRQCKHSGFYNKALLGNNFNFYGKSLYAPNWGMIPQEHERGQNTDLTIYGYERIWDTKEVFEHKLKQRRIMEMSSYAVPDEKKYIQNFVQERRLKMANAEFMSINNQPKIIQEKLRSVDETMFGFNLFEGDYE